MSRRVPSRHGAWGDVAPLRYQPVGEVAKPSRGDGDGYNDYDEDSDHGDGGDDGNGNDDEIDKTDDDDWLILMNNKSMAHAHGAWGMVMLIQASKRW